MDSAEAQVVTQYRVGFTKHTGLLFALTSSTRIYQGSIWELEQAYKAAQTHDLIAGWWSPASLIANPIVIVRNYLRLRSVKRLVSQA